MPLSLANAYARVARAREHLDELKLLCHDVCQNQAKNIVVHTQGEFTLDLTKKGKLADLFRVETKELVPIPDRVALLIGDTANSLRAALNYLVGRLADLDSGPAKRRTQFPIEATSDGFRGRSKEYLAGLSAKHIGAIESLQPYKGCNWTQPLAKLSNFDKHDDLVVVAHDMSAALQVRVSPTDNPEVADMDAHLHLKPLLHVVLGDGLPRRRNVGDDRVSSYPNA